MVERCWRYCVSATVSVAMRIEDMGYGLHGHDITVTACFSSRRRHNIDGLRGLLEETLRPVDHQALWEVLGVSDAMVEDLLLWLEERLGERVKGLGLSLSSLRASLPSGEILVDFEDRCRSH